MHCSPRLTGTAEYGGATLWVAMKLSEKFKKEINRPADWVLFANYPGNDETANKAHETAWKKNMSGPTLGPL